MVNRRAVLVGGGLVVAAGAGLAYAGVQSMGTMADYNALVAESRARLREVPETRELVRYATLAANSHNTQPWRFRVTQAGIDILPDPARRLAIVDPDDHHLFASLGCAAENLVIATVMRGMVSAVTFDPSQGGVVSVAIGKGATGGSSESEPALFDAILTRQSTRQDFDGRTVSAGDLRLLAAAAATVPGVDMVLVTDRVRMDQVRDLVIAGNSVQMADPAFLRELKSWIRFNPRQAIETGDGLFSAASGNPVVPTWAGPVMLDFVFKTDAENDKYARQIASSAGIAVFIAGKSDPEHWYLAGRACQRFALQATALGLNHAFINQPVEVPGLRPDLAALVGMAGRRPDIVMRFGYGAALPYSARRNVAAVLA